MMAPPGEAEDNEKHLTAYRKAATQRLESIAGAVAATTNDVNEYEALKIRLTDLPKKLYHHIMVPYGSVGFMPGRIVHTNEVMMLLGDGYFAERSCYEACEAIDRRLDILNQSLKDCESEKTLLNDQLAFAEQLYNNNKVGGGNEEIEIREEYDEATEEKLKARRRKRALEVTSEQSEKSGTDVNDVGDIMKRLEELELLEIENGELLTEDSEDPTLQSEDDVSPPPGINKEDYQKLLNHLNEQSSDSEEYDSSADDEEHERNDKLDLDSDDLEEGESEDGPMDVKTAISKAPKKRRSVRFAEDEKLENATLLYNDQPACVIKRAENDVQCSTGSILRNVGMKSPTDGDAVAAMVKEDSRVRIVPTSADAFSGIVVERKVEEDNRPGPSNVSEYPEPVKRVSKFKMDRARR